VADRLTESNQLWNIYESEHEREKYRNRIRRFIVPIIQQENASRILEVGAGSGYGSILLKDLGFDVEAVDPFFREDIRKQFPFLRKGSGLSMPYFSDQEFDLTFSLEVIEHVGTTDGGLALAPDFREQRAQFISELCRVTRGPVVIATPNKRFPVDEHGNSFLGSFRPHSPFENETLSVRELKQMFSENGFPHCNYLDPRGYFALARVEKLFGPKLAKTANAALRTTNNRFLGPTILNPHLFLSFCRSR
jgi:SAM-dependent methyltransferase